MEDEQEEGDVFHTQPSRDCVSKLFIVAAAAEEAARQFKGSPPLSHSLFTSCPASLSRGHADRLCTPAGTHPLLVATV